MISDLFKFLKYFYTYNNIFNSNVNVPYNYDNIFYNFGKKILQ